MAAVADLAFGSWIWPSGLAGLLLLLLVSILLTALCSDCGRRSFELKDPKTEKNPSALISVVKLEEARENPMISQIRSDEKQFDAEIKQVQETTSTSHQEAPKATTESCSEEEEPVPFVPWRNHLVEPVSQDVITPPDSSQIHSVKAEEGVEPSPPVPHRRAEMDGWTD